MSSSKTKFDKWVESIEPPDWLVELQKRDRKSSGAYVRERQGNRWVHIQKEVSYAEMEESKRVAIEAIMSPVREMKREMEEKWGVDRLPSLVSDDLAARFASAAGKLEEALKSEKIAAIKGRAEIMLKGWKKLDEVAQEEGAPTARDPDVFEGKRPDGKIFRVARYDDHALRLHRRDGIVTFSMEEIGGILEAFDNNGFTYEIKKEFGGKLNAVPSEEDIGG